MPIGIESRRRQLQAFFSRASVIPSDQEELRSDLAKHGIVLVCGFIERCVEEVVLDKVKRYANIRVQKFVKAHFNRGKNFNCGAIAELLDRFDLKWSSNITSYLNGRDDLTEAIRSAYEVRNSIAHGGSANKGLADVIVWFEAAQEVVNAMVQATA